MSKEDIRELAEDNAIYEFNKFKKDIWQLCR